MKTKLLTHLSMCTIMFTLLSASCNKNKNKPAVENPLPPANEQEVVTTFKITFTDSSTGGQAVYFYKDPDGDGGQAGFYGPGITSSSSQNDSVMLFQNNKTYYANIVLLDETKNPVDSISNEVVNEGENHMFFYNNGANTILNSGTPYTVKLQNSGIQISYLDLDNGNPKRNIGLKTRWRTYSSVSNKQFLNVTLRHQPNVKDGTFAPGETDVSINFKYQVL